MKSPLIIYWSRRDFRCADNPALTGAVAESERTGTPLLPLFILEDYMCAGDPASQFGFPSRVCVSRMLPAFAGRFPSFVVVQGKAVRYLTTLSESFALTVFVNDDVYPDFAVQVGKIRAAGIHVEVFDDALTVPEETRTGEGKLYSVFTPFKKAVWMSFVSASALPAPDLGRARPLDADTFARIPARVDISESAIMRAMSDARTVRVGGRDIDLTALTAPPNLDQWYYDEDGALARFDLYLKSGSLDAYAEGRDSLEHDVEGDGATSRMSLALAWGLVSSRMLVDRMRSHFGEPFDNPFSLRVSQGALTYLSELMWREFYRYQLLHHPELLDTEFQERYRGTIAWVGGEEAERRFTLWIRGMTGYPIVDAAMRQIAHTGWMHNRARMIVASVLTKNLGIDWRWGQEYFRAALVDLDEASNNGGWQWGASVGADPKPIRIFNPELQAKRYDGSGAYVTFWNGSNTSDMVPIVAQRDAREAALKRYGLLRAK